jgi:chromosome segregation ATPase
MSDLMGHDEASVSGTEGTPRWVGIAVVALAVVSLVSLGVGWNATTQARNAEQNLSLQAKSSQQNEDALAQRLSQTEEADAQVQSDLNVVTNKLQLTQAQLDSARRGETQIKKDYTSQINNVNTQLATKASANDVTALGGDVNGVKTDLEATKASLASTTDQFGQLIAKNHDEIDQLRRLGERDYYEFTLTSTSQKQTVGDMQVQLRGTNVKHNQFSLALYVDDMRLEKNNRAVDEPIYFYTRGTHTPLELVINQIGKNKISGYLSVPKANPTQAPASASGAAN